MEELCFKYSNVRPEQMADKEVVIVNDLYTIMKHEVDPVLLIEYLFKIKCVDKHAYSYFHDKAIYWSKPILLEFLLANISSLCSLSTLINVLRDLGYSHISYQLLKRWLLPQSSVVRVNRMDTSNRKPVQQYFKMLKRKIWNAEFKDPLNTLRSLTKRLKISMMAENDVQKRQCLADKVVAVLGVEIDAHAITFDTELSEHHLFKELRDIVPHTTNTMITDVILYGRRANACAIGKHFSLGEKYLQKAKACSTFLTPCLELANMLYCEVYVKLWEFEQNPSREIRESLVQMAEVGIECLTDEEEEIRVLWTRMFLLRMAFCLLGIGNRTNIIPNCTTIKCIEKAHQILDILDTALNDMDTRREMFYQMASARLSELEGNLPLALEKIRMSFRLAMDGKFKEQYFICQHLKYIELQMDKLTHYTNNTSSKEFIPFDLKIDDMLNPDSVEQLDQEQSLIEDDTHLKKCIIGCNESPRKLLTFIGCTRLNLSNLPECSIATTPSLNVTSYEWLPFKSNSMPLSSPTISSDFVHIYDPETCLVQNRQLLDEKQEGDTFEDIGLESVPELNTKSFEKISGDGT